MLAIFLPQVEGTIAATALISITNDLRGFNESSWIITAYMLTYTCLFSTHACAMQCSNFMSFQVFLLSAQSLVISLAESPFY